MPNNQFQTVLSALTVIIKQLVDDIPTMYHLPIPNLPSPLPPYDPKLTLVEYLSTYYSYPVIVTPVIEIPPTSNPNQGIIYYSKIQALISGTLMNNNGISASGNCTSQTNNDNNGYRQQYADWLAGIPAVQDAINEANKLISLYNTSIETNMNLIQTIINNINNTRPLSIGS